MAAAHHALIENALRNFVGNDCRLSALVPVAGGSINTCYRAESDQGAFFVKFGDTDSADIFAAEVDGLEALRRAESFVVPAVIGIASCDGKNCLILEH